MILCSWAQDEDKVYLEPFAATNDKLLWYDVNPSLVNDGLFISIASPLKLPRGRFNTPALTLTASNPPSGAQAKPHPPQRTAPRPSSSESDSLPFSWVWRFKEQTWGVDRQKQGWLRQIAKNDKNDGDPIFGAQSGKTSKNTVCGALGCVATIKLNRGPAGRFSETDLPYPTPNDDVLLHLKHF